MWNYNSIITRGGRMTLAMGSSDVELQLFMKLVLNMKPILLMISLIHYMYM